MKQFLTILFVLLSCASFAQFPNTHTQSNSHTKEVFLGAINPQKGLINTRYPDTATANLDYIAGEPGGQIIVGNTIYVRNTTATGWIISANSSVTPSNVTIYNDSTLIICNNNGCDSFKTNIVINNFNIVNDSTIIVCDGNNSCDTINTNPTVFAKSYVDSTKIIDGIIYYYINGNAYNGGSISNFVYDIVDSLADTKVTIENGTIISGIRVSYDSLLTFSITSGYYRLNDSTYYYSGGSVTLPAADATNPTIDAIILDTTGVTVLQGVPATNPASPQITGFQILLTNVTVNANATTPVGISNSSIIYDENTETTTSSTMTADFNDVAQPFHLIKDISATAGLSGSYQQFLFGSIQSSIDYTNITLHIRLNASLSKKSDLSIQFFNGTANVSQSIILGTNYGFNKNLTGTYQTVVIPISDFNFYSSNFNIVRLTFTGNSFSSFYMDYIVLQTGVSGGGSSTFTQIQSDWSQTVNTQPDYIKNKPVVYTKTQTDSIAVLKLNTTDTTNKWIPKGTYFPIGVHKPLIAIDSFDIGLDSFNLKELRYSLAQRDTTNWTDTTLIDKKFFLDRLASYTPGGVTWGSITGTLSDQTDLQSALDAKQTTLVSGTNIKTINGNSLLGSGDLTISGGGSSSGVDSTNTATTAGQTIFTFPYALTDYTVSKQVTRNGVLIDPSDYTVNTGNITFTGFTCDSGDKIRFIGVK